LERGTSTCTLLSSPLIYFPCFMHLTPKKSRQGENLGSL
jgi:hypothetical protein